MLGDLAFMGLFDELFGTAVMNNYKVYIYDDGIIYLYDINSQSARKIVSSNSIGFGWLYDESGRGTNNEGRYIKVRNDYSGLYGIIDKDGNLIHEFNLGIPDGNAEIKKQFMLNKYSIADDLIVDYQNGKFGVVKITSNDIVVDYQYDDIELVDSTTYKAKLNDEWNTYNY